MNAPRRMAAPPTCNSARELASAHKRSPVVSGRLTTAHTQSGWPAGEKLTVPLIALRRATREGGSAAAQPQNVMRRKLASTSNGRLNVGMFMGILFRKRVTVVSFGETKSPPQRGDK